MQENNVPTKNKQRWLMQSVGGLLLTGAGLTMTIDAAFVKMNGGHWIWYGTAALVVFQSGLCLVIDSLRYHPKN